MLSGILLPEVMGSKGLGFRPLIIPLMWQAGKKSSPTGLAPTSPLIIDESGLRV